MVVMEEISGCFLQVLITNYTMAHCISVERRLQGRIAYGMYNSISTFKNRIFFCPLINVGEIGVMRLRRQDVCLLITKRSESDKCTIADLTKCIIALKDYVTRNNVLVLAIPRLGCGYCGHEWTIVKQIIEKVFCDTCITIKVYYK